MKELRLELERRKADELRLQTHVQELEHRFLGSDAAKKDDEIRDLQASARPRLHEVIHFNSPPQDEMRKLRLQLKQSEVDADQDRYMKNKVNKRTVHRPTLVALSLLRSLTIVVPW